MNPLNTPAGGSAFLEELEINVCTELTLAETGPSEEEAVSLPIEEWLSDPEDEQRYEAGLQNLLGAVEAMRRTETEGVLAMQVTREHVVHMLRIAALPDLAEEVHRVLPDPVEYNYVERFLAQYGITKDGLISRRGGSP